MDYALFVSLVGFSFIATITPGPNNLLLLSSGALFGLRRTIPHLAGIQLGFAMLMLASVFGLGSVVTTWPWSLDVIRIIGASWLVWLSLRFFRAAIQPNRAGSESQAAPISRPFRLVEAFLFQWINPKGIIAAVSSAGAYIAISDNVWQRAAILTTVFVSAGTICCGTWTVAGDAMNRYLSSGKSAVWTNGLMGVLIVATAALILFG